MQEKQRKSTHKRLHVIKTRSCYKQQCSMSPSILHLCEHTEIVCASSAMVASVASSHFQWNCCCYYCGAGYRWLCVGCPTTHTDLIRKIIFKVFCKAYFFLSKARKWDPQEQAAVTVNLITAKPVNSSVIFILSCSSCYYYWTVKKTFFFARMFPPGVCCPIMLNILLVVLFNLSDLRGGSILKACVRGSCHRTGGRLP